MRNLAIGIALMTAAHAGTAGGVPVFDGVAVSNLIQQIAYWQQQIAAMSSQLDQLKRSHAAMTGPRGMDDALPTTQQQRNYLPANYQDVLRTVNGNSATYSGLSSHAQAVMAHNAMLESQRRSSALLSAFTQTAYQHTSHRFHALQQLITMLGTTADQKSILDLQGRISAEQVMLTNEQTKLQALYQAIQAQQITQQQRLRESVILGHGSFEAKFSPRRVGVVQP
jgi:type IV secretion system protein VirB5